jgi:sn-glycerol 3-phosphate transport system ATP-binding protein
VSAALSLEGVAKSWDGATALSRLSLAIEPGELVTILGPSGSGKSTALRIVAGLETPDSGTVTIGGRDVTAVEPSKRGVAMVFQSFALFPHLSAEDNIAFGLRARGTSREAARARAREVAEPLGLSALLERRPAQLSGGERQRVALARGLAGNPDVLLLDEPLSNLDARLRAEARAEVRRVQEATGVTTLYVTHDQDEALALGHRVVVLDRGELQQVGTPDEIYDRPANRFVASFVGEPPMNLVPPQVIGLERDGVVAGFRAEHVRVGDGPLTARLELAERTGHESLWHLDLDGTRIIARAAGGRAGEQVRLGIDPAGIRLFDERTGEAR